MRDGIGGQGKPFLLGSKSATSPLDAIPGSLLTLQAMALAPGERKRFTAMQERYKIVK